MLDLDREDLDAVFTRAAALAAAELDATRCGPVFASAPSAANLHAVLDEPLPVDGEPLDDVLEACEAVLAAGRRTAPGFFGYVQSPPTAVGVIADLLASAADQNVTAWRSAPAAVHVERPFQRCGMGSAPMPVRG
jgi:hypothetical protein